MSVARVTLVSRPASVRAARAWLAPLLVGWQDEATRHDALLLMSEVVTNSVRHARGGRISIVVTMSAKRLLAQVKDDSPDVPLRRDAGPAGGWGLGLLDDLSERWGVDQHPDDGKTVWFEITASG